MSQTFTTTWKWIISSTSTQSDTEISYLHKDVWHFTSLDIFDTLFTCLTLHLLLDIWYFTYLEIFDTLFTYLTLHLLIDIWYFTYLEIFLNAILVSVLEIPFGLIKPACLNHLSDWLSFIVEPSEDLSPNLEKSEKWVLKRALSEKTSVERIKRKWSVGCS